MSLTSSTSNSTQQYDYIILGAGCAGLSLAVRMAGDPFFANKKILLIDKGPKSSNDRTWCFWEKQPGFFESIVHHQWQQLEVNGPDGSLQLKMEGYAYKMIRGIDFYRHCFASIRQAPNIHLHYGLVQQVDSEHGLVQTDGGNFSADHIFSSVLLQDPDLQLHDYYLLQHFRGWWITTEEDRFDAGKAHFMNFNTSQQHGCAFMYVLPVSSRMALVEHTLFTEETLQDHEYDEALRHFIRHELTLESYHLSEVENGIIPMTSWLFPKQEGKITFIGTAGGQTKASTGFTFQFIQKHSRSIVEALKAGSISQVPTSPARFQLYDAVLLRVLHERKLGGDTIFYNLFRKNPASRVFRFLDNESSLVDEIRIMNSTPWRIFLPAALAAIQRRQH